MNQVSYFDCASISAYDVLRGRWERLSGTGVVVRDEALISSGVSGHVICASSSSSSPGAIYLSGILGLVRDRKGLGLWPCSRFGGRLWAGSLRPTVHALPFTSRGRSSGQLVIWCWEKMYIIRNDS